MRSASALNTSVITLPLLEAGSSIEPRVAGLPAVQANRDELSRGILEREQVSIMQEQPPRETEWPIVDLIEIELCIEARLHTQVTGLAAVGAV